MYENRINFKNLTSSVPNLRSGSFGEYRPGRRNIGPQQLYHSAEVCVLRAVFIGDFCGLGSQRRMLNADGWRRETSSPSSAPKP